MEHKYQKCTIQVSEHTVCRLTQLELGEAYAALKGELAAYMQIAKPGRKATIIANDEKYELILWGPPQEISEAYQIAMAFLCNRLRKEVQLLRTTTITNDYYHELRTTTTTNYDYDEIRLRRNTIKTTPVIIVQRETRLCWLVVPPGHN